MLLGKPRSVAPRMAGVLLLLVVGIVAAVALAAR
jgi:hypothetical protein